MEKGDASSHAFTIGQLARRTGVAASALRYYESLGLIHSQRNEAGHRRYPRAVARRVAFIVFAQRVGLTLEEIRAELEKLPADRVPTEEDWRRLAKAWQERIDQQIAQLQRLKEGLTDCIGCGCLSLARCAILNPNDRMAKFGPGPRFWVGDVDHSPGCEMESDDERLRAPGHQGVPPQPPVSCRPHGQQCGERNIRLHLHGDLAGGCGRGE